MTSWLVNRFPLFATGQAVLAWLDARLARTLAPDGHRAAWRGLVSAGRWRMGAAPSSARCAARRLTLFGKTPRLGETNEYWQLVLR